MPMTRAPIEPAATLDDEPFVGGAEVVAGGAVEDAAEVAGLLSEVVIVGLAASELLLDSPVGEGAGVGGGAASDVVSGGGTGAAVVVTYSDDDDAGGDGGGGGGAPPVVVTWICPSVYSLTGT